MLPLPAENPNVQDVFIIHLLEITGKHKGKFTVPFFVSAVALGRFVSRFRLFNCDNEG